MLEEKIKAYGCAELTQSHDCVLTNNPNGVFFTRHGQPIRTKPVGYPDTTGWRSVIVSPEMLGHRLAIFVGIEWKSSTGRPTMEQEAWIHQMKKDGCLAGFARSVDEAVAIVRAIR